LGRSAGSIFLASLPLVGVACGGGAGFCEPGLKQCYDQEIVETCAEDGSVWNREYCEVGEICTEGECLPESCEPGTIYCLDANTVATCQADGLTKTEVDCGDGMVCVDGECSSAQSCTPGELHCADAQTVEQCAEDGSSWEFVETCEYGTTGVSCFNGECMDLCAQSSLSQSYIGCEYVAADLHNLVDMTYAIVVSNTNETLNADVSIESSSGLVTSATVAAGDLEILEIQQDTYSVCRSGSPAEDPNPCSEIAEIALRVTSTVPITAYQFNPLDNSGQPYSNDASLLLPAGSLGTEYIVMARHHNHYSHWLHGSYDMFGSMTVAAMEEGVTSVTITPTFAVEPGLSIPSFQIGTPTTFELNQFELINLETTTDQQDPTGTTVVADKPVAVFGGSPCTFIPDDTWACDHLEEQIFPLQSWGTHMVAPKTYPRKTLLGYGGVEDDLFRFLASEDNTVIEIEPTIPGTPLTLNAGEHVEISSTTDFVAWSDKPFLLGQFIVGEDDIGSIAMTGIGDPAFMLIPPSEQYRSDYIILVPNAYAYNFASIICEAGTTVSIDGIDIAAQSFDDVGNGEYVRAWVELQEGVYQVVGDHHFGIMVYGYDQYVSYGYAGGLNLQPINNVVLE